MKLEPKVTEVLAYLATRPGEVVSRDDIEQAVWPNACCWPVADPHRVASWRNSS